MATPRSSLPLRLRQLLSGEGAVGPSLKLESETPPEIKSFIDRVIKSPLQDIAIPLLGFRWEYNKGNFHHWRSLFLHFDTYFKTYISCRKDLLLSDNISEDDAFPKQAVLQILRVMQIILENCHNKSSFSGFEHFKLLLASTDPEILLATLETLAALVKINPSKLHVSGKLISCGVLNERLLCLAQGWGSKEEGLGLYSCVVANEQTHDESLSLFPSEIYNEAEEARFRMGSTLHFEFHTDPSNLSMRQSSCLQVLHFDDMHCRREDDLAILKNLVEQHNVPQDHRFSLLTRIRFAHSVRSSKICRMYSRICLLAFLVLVQSNDAHDELVSFFANDPEYTNELIRLVHSGEAIPGTIKTLAMVALGAELAAYSSSPDRARILSGSSIISAGGNRMILLSVLQKAILLLKGDTNDPTVVSFAEALLQFYFLHIISSSSSGSVIRGSGIVPTLLPLLQDVDLAHVSLVCSAVRTLQKLMDYNHAAVSLFKDLSGVELLAQRLKIEVERIVPYNPDRMLIGDSMKQDDETVFNQKRLIKSLLKALVSATYAPANSTRSHNSYEGSLPSSLSTIFKNVNKFGGDIYSAAVTVMSEMIHKDPTCFSALHELGLPNDFLSSVTAGVFPSSKSITCIPSGLSAICLNARGLDSVKETAALGVLLDIFTSKKYVLALNEGIVSLANAVEELLRHVSSLREAGVNIILEIIEKLISVGSPSIPGPSDKLDGNSAMETDLDDMSLSLTSLASDNLSSERFLQLAIFHVMVFIHRIMENTEACRLFVEKKGIESLLKLLLRPSIAQSSEGMSIALHSTVVFKGFAPHHSAPLARAFITFLRVHMKAALCGFTQTSNTLLLDPQTTSDSGIFSTLFVIEFLFFLAASKENRWIMALLSEFGNESKDVLEDIGRIHQQVLWQIALLDDSKVGRGEVTSISSGSTQRGTTHRSTLSSTNDIDDQRLTSFRHFIDPLIRRRVSGWSIESQFFDLINLYRDLGRAASSPSRLGSQNEGSLRIGSTLQQNTSALTDAGASNKVDTDKKRSYHLACFDMLKSLSFHISYMFQELGKAMMLPPRRRDDPSSVSPAARSVVATFASILLDHLNFGGPTCSSSSDGAIAIKCRYLGKVVDFIDNILMDKPDSCNPVLVNCLYRHGVIQAILTTFEATSQLLFAVRKGLASPMDTDDANVKQDEKDYSWIHGPLVSYGTLMDHLVTSPFILSPLTRNLLIQPFTTGVMAIPRDPEVFVKLLQSKVLKAILPIWTQPHLAEWNQEFTTTIISIMRHIVSGVEVKNINNVGSRMTGPPPDESAISMIVEMGFSRSRAEEALRQVGTNSVEMAMEWLFSHPEEIQEDDELARALAMSLGNTDTSTAEDKVMGSSNLEQEDEFVQLPPVEEILSTCTVLLQTKEPLAFPIHDLLVTISSQNGCRDKVINFILDHLKLCSSNSSMLFALYHVLALIMQKDSMARQVACKNGLLKITLALLPRISLSSHAANAEVPNWVTTAFLAIDRMMQVDANLSSENSLVERLEKDDTSQLSTQLEKPDNIEHSLSLSPHGVDPNEQKVLMEIACGYIKNHLPSDVIHAVLQLCATLTKAHPVAISFLEAGGLNHLLSLPTSSLFSGFDGIAATVIRHILEDPHTLQQAMESEIKHVLLGSGGRRSSGRMTLRHFLQNLSSVIARDPMVFLQAAQTTCQVEMVGERPHIILLKDRDKSKDKEKEKPAEANDMSSGDHFKHPDSNSKTNRHRKPPQSFVTVIENLLEHIMVIPFSKDQDHVAMNPGTQLRDMDIDVASTHKEKGKAILTVSDNKVENQDSCASLAKIIFILKLLSEILMTYAPAIHVVLKKDNEVGITRRTSTEGIFYHVLHEFLLSSGSSKKENKKSEVDWRQKLATRARQFLVAASVRSVECRKRVFTEINNIFTAFNEPTDRVYILDDSISVYVDLINDIVSARSPTGAYISAEAAVTFIDAGLVRSFTRTLKVLDLDYPESPKIVNGIIKALESVTKEHVHAAGASSSKAGNLPKHTSDQNPSERINISNTDTNEINGFQPLETVSQPGQSMLSINHNQSLNAIQVSTSLGSISDDMEHDQDSDGNEDDFMHETSEEAGGLENGNNGAVSIRFEIQHNEQESLDDEDDDDDDMTGDGDDRDDDEGEDEEEAEDHNGMDQSGDHMSHADMDQDDHDDEDEFDDLVEGDDEDDGVILRLEEGLGGVSVLDHIEVFSRDSNLNNDGFHLMPVEIFGSRRQGRTTSIYNLLGRGGDNGPSCQHPLLIESQSSSLPASRQTENNSARLETIFRSLRGGQSGHRSSIWLDGSRTRSGGSTGSTVPPGMEDILLSRLRRSSPNQPSSVVAPMQTQEGEPNSSQEATMRDEIPTERDVNSGSEPLPSATALPDVATGAGPVENEMQFERSDVAVRDVEVVSQESGGSGATLGESLRSLEVEVGSTDGHDDGGERPLDRARRANAASGTTTVSSRDVPVLHNISEVQPVTTQVADPSANPAAEQQTDREVDSNAIDPTFLDALPEELRAEVLSAQQGQVAQPSHIQNQSVGEIDPEFLAALPPDIRAEVLAQQQAQRLHQSQELEGQPVEMDTVSIIATFPSELREEVLLTSPDAVLANLTPALVAEANMLRERFAQYQGRSFLGMYPRSRRGESSRRGETLGFRLDRALGSIGLRKVSGKVIEAEGAPLVDKEALKALIRLLWVVQPLYKGQFQRLLLNLCAHNEIRTALVEIMMDLLMLDIYGPVKDVVVGGSSYRLYGGQSSNLHSRAEPASGIPPLVSRRILETLTYLGRNHPYVAKLLLHLELSRVQGNDGVPQAQGKGVMTLEDGFFVGKNGTNSLVMLLALLSQPLYLRSVVHLEQLLNLLEVVIESAENNLERSLRTEVAPSTQPSDSQASVVDAKVSHDGVGPSVDIATSSKNTTDAISVLMNLPRSELQLLCSLLARDGLSDNVYILVAEVLKKLVSIAPMHCCLFVKELAEAVQKLAISARQELLAYAEAEKLLVSTASVDGTAILRVLQALSSLVSLLIDKGKDSHVLSEEDYRGALSLVWDINATLEPLWLELSFCINKIESLPDPSSDFISSSSSAGTTLPQLPAGTHNILPYIESFFVTCEKLRPDQLCFGHDGVASDAEDVASSSSSTQRSGPPQPKSDDKEIAFARFSEKHRKLLNAFIRQNPGLLEKSLSLMLRVPRFIDFDNKRAHFRSKIKHQHDHHHSPLRISVRRAYILEDSYNQLRMRSTLDLKGRLTVHFQGEEGIDAGGLTREWYQLLSRVIFDKGALLFTTVGNASTFQPNPNSVYQTEHLSYFKFVGRVVGKALFDGQLMDVHFTRSFYKHILGAKVTYHDIEAIDPDYYKNLKWVLENDISDVLDLSFSMDADEEKLILYERAEVTDYELIPGGRNVRVTEENKHQYVDLVAEHRLTTAIRPQINAFLEGFSELIPRELISIFNDKELELLISGLPDVDLEDMRANTEYSGYSAASQVIQWFWEVVQGFSKEDKARLLQFVTGTSKVPLEGFSALQGISGSQKFQIHKAYGSPERLPSAHTCFNQLDLPEYSSKPQLQERLLLAIHEGSEGFGFG